MSHGIMLRFDAYTGGGAPVMKASVNIDQADQNTMSKFIDSTKIFKVNNLNNCHTISLLSMPT